MLYCVQCKDEVKPIKTNGKEIYPHRKDLYHLTFYKCPQCGNYVGCHKGTNTALGCIPTKELKQARIKAHNYMDSFWKSGRVKRNKIYKSLTEHFGYEYHNGNTKSVEECEEAIKVIKENFEVLDDN